jgi:hypothetical protein
MNLKEIGILLLSLYLASSLLIAYKYYKARGGVFKISRMLVFKYIYRFVLLVGICVLCYYTTSIKPSNELNTSGNNFSMFAIASNSSSLTWKSIHAKVSEMPKDGHYSLTMFMPKEQEWLQIIPSTNKDSFLQLIEHAHESQVIHSKLVITDKLNRIPKEDQFVLYSVKNGHWEVEDRELNNSSFLSTNLLNSWIGASYVRFYLVFLILFLLFLDIAFTAKAIKI